MSKEITPLISLEDVTLIKNRSIILENINFSVNKGDILTIIGPNGAGKSTLLKLIIGQLKATSGKITKQPDLKIGYVPQQVITDSLLPLTVESFVGTNNPFLSILDLSELGTHFLHTLSGGELQRTLLCRALSRKPELLLLDESSQGLDISGILKFYELIDKINKETNTSIIMISHDLNIVLSRSDKVICLDKHICCQGISNRISSDKGFIELFGDENFTKIGLYRHNHEQQAPSQAQSEKQGTQI